MGNLTMCMSKDERASVATQFISIIVFILIEPLVSQAHVCKILIIIILVFRV